MFANYHTHTARCHHATGEDKAYVEAAIQNGFQVLGFSDHCPWIFSDGYVSPIRMTPDELDGYVTSLTALKKEYAADITIYIGLESEYVPEMLPEQQKFLQDYPIDYQILGEHFLYPEQCHPSYNKCHLRQLSRSGTAWHLYRKTDRQCSRTKTLR